MAGAIQLDREIASSAKRARRLEEQNDAIRVTDAKRLSATRALEAQESKRKLIADAAAALTAKKNADLAAASARSYKIWLQTVFAARHAAKMAAFISSMSQEGLNHATSRIIALSMQGIFKRWVTIDDPWYPDTSLYHYFGSLPDIDRRFDKPSRRQVRCSPELSAFILGETSYAHPLDGPNPESAINCLFQKCFILPQCMFKNACSIYQLMCRSHHIIDLAFARAVLTVSKWLGPEAMPNGYIANWPPAPPEGYEPHG